MRTRWNDLLSRNPHDINADAWYYEEPEGLEIIVQVGTGGPKHLVISWPKIAKSWRRYLRARRVMKKQAHRAKRRERRGK
jgi:hypothetical protein